MEKRERERWLMHFSTVQSHTTAGRYGFMIDRGLSIDPSLRLDSTLPSEESQTRQLRVGRAKKKGEGKEFPQTSRSSSSTTTHQRQDSKTKTFSYGGRTHDLAVFSPAAGNVACGFSACGGPGGSLNLKSETIRNLRNRKKENLLGQCTARAWDLKSEI